MRGLKGRNVLVTGGGSGIGQAIAIRFAEYGTNATPAGGEENGSAGA